MATAPYLDQIEQNINSLLAEGRFDKAYSQVNDYLDKYPKAKNLKKLKKKIEEDVEDRNKEVVKGKMMKIDELWKQEKYVEILRELKRMIELDPENDKLKDLFQKTQDKYRDQLETQTKGFEKDQGKKLDQLLEQDTDKFLEELYFIEEKNPQNPKVAAMVKKYREKYISKVLSEKKDFIYSNKFEEIMAFISKLKKIDPENKDLNKVEKHIRQKMRKSHIEKKSEYLYKGNEYLDTLLKMKKYDKAAQVAKELLEFGGKNEKLEKILKGAEKKDEKQNRNEVIDKINKDKESLKEEYKKNKKRFVKV